MADDRVLPPRAERSARHLLGAIDRERPGLVVGYYVVGSTALGAYRPDRSDVDVVGVLAGDPGSDAVAGLRRAHRRTLLALAPGHLPRRARGDWSGACNGVFVRASDLHRPPGDVAAVASCVGTHFAAGSGFDVNPVTWHVLAHQGVAVRGPAADTLGVPLDDAELRRWTRANLDRYWRGWAAAAGARRPNRTAARALTRHGTAWGVLGPPRLHRTIATGEIVSKERAGELALEAFPPRWHPVVHEALAFWRGEPTTTPYRSRGARSARRRDAAAFAAAVVDAGMRLPV
jgi:hypothetical protein